ncbi:MAG: hypothetical protein KF874_14315 [Rhizobiaceae bacterium]|nr:hypothetical protein [Rhizobiaceae bacterium]
MAKQQKNDELAESRRILGQIEQETTYGRAAQKLRNHLGAADADQNDVIETWGTRIGRIIGFLFTIAIILFFIRYLISA